MNFRKRNVWRGFCVNCGRGIIKGPNGKNVSEYVPGKLETVPEHWIRVRTSSTKVLKNGQVVELGPKDGAYIYVCSPKCAHEMEQFFAGGGVQYSTGIDPESGKLNWEYGKSE